MTLLRLLPLPPVKGLDGVDAGLAEWVVCALLEGFADAGLVPLAGVEVRGADGFAEGGAPDCATGELPERL